MTPQGFGFESRTGDRRSGQDRRASERRATERRHLAIVVQSDQRLGRDRRSSERRAELRRTLLDRRNRTMSLRRGLRITNSGDIPPHISLN